MESERTGTTHQIGVSPDFVKASGLLSMDPVIEKALGEAKPTVVKASDTMPAVQAYLEDEGFQHIVLVPVQGKKATVGTLALGKAHAFAYTPDDLTFLQTSANQLGMAVENLRLLEQVSRSQRQWMNTFDSIQDAILAHDPEFVITKANQALLQHLPESAEDVVGSKCEDALPTKFSKWSGCPYCSRGDVDFVEGPDPCFGASRWCPPQPTSSRAVCKKASFTSSAILPTGAARKKNTACCSSRCRRGYSSRPPKANCSIAMRRSCACWATKITKSSWH